MTKCYKINGKVTKSLHGDTYLKLDGIHTDVEVPFSIWLDVTIGQFVSCKFETSSMSYKVLNVYSEDGILLKRNKKQVCL